MHNNLNRVDGLRSSHRCPAVFPGLWTSLPITYELAGAGPDDTHIDQRKWGKYNQYDGSGFAQVISRNYTEAKEDFRRLRRDGFINVATRTLFVENPLRIESGSSGGSGGGGGGGSGNADAREGHAA